MIKKITFVCVAFLGLLSTTNYGQTSCTDYVDIPDANFKAALLADTSINTNGDGEISCLEASRFSGFMYVDNKSISSLKGIEAFTSLRSLHCDDNLLKFIDVSNNLVLESLFCEDNELESLDVSNNLELLHLNFNNNHIRSIDVSYNTSLYSIGSAGNELTDLDLSNNAQLVTLGCSSNKLTDLDLSKLSHLQFFGCSSNNLKSLNVANGSNGIITVFIALNNPDLECIQVDNENYSTVNWQNIDATTSFSEDCEAFCPAYVTIPDANFKAILVSDTTINTDGDTEICIKEAANFTGVIYAWASTISDLTGIEAFINITGLYCDYNTLTTLDVSNNKTLVNLSCGSNSLTNLNVANGNNINMGNFDFIALNNPDLECIQVDDVNYSTANWKGIDATASFSENCSTFCTAYVTIPDANFKAILVSDPAINTDGDDEICYREATAFTGIIYVWSSDISDLTGIEAFTNITELYCDYNTLTTLDVSNNRALTKLSCSSNNLTNLNVANGNNINIENFNFIAFNNPDLECIKVDNVAYSTANWTLKDATASFNTHCGIGICIVNIPDANFKTILIQNTSINTDGDTEISCEEAEAFNGVVNVSNKLILDVTGIEAFTNITGLYCDYNMLTTLDSSNNTALTVLSCSSNNLTSLNVANGNNSNMGNFNFIAFNNPDLQCIEVDDVAYSSANWMLKDATANFSTDCTTLLQKTSVSNKKTSSNIDNKFNTDISVYPNPVIHTIHIGVKTGTELEEVQIYNLLGKMVLKSRMTNINVDGLTPGPYVLKVRGTNGEVIIKKIIKK